MHCRPAMASTPKYLAPYIFRVAISNRRILRVEDGRVPIRVQRLLMCHRLSHHRSPSSAARPVARPQRVIPDYVKDYVPLNAFM